MRVAVVASCVVLVSCGSTPADTLTDPRPTRGDLSGDVIGAPSVEVLPHLANAQETSGPFREAWAQGLVTLGARPPVAPGDMSLVQSNQWLRTEMVPWLRGRGERVSRLRKTLTAAAGTGAVERIAGNALLALIEEDNAAIIGSIPVPAEISDDDQLADVFVNQLRTQAQPAVERSLEAYRRCAAAARAAGPDRRHWRSFCDGRGERLASRHGPLPVADPCGSPEPFERVPGPETEPVVAVMFRGGLQQPFLREERERLIAAIHRRLDAALEVPVLPRSEVEAAAALARAGRLAEGAPMCGIPPDIEAVLAAAHPHVLMADASAWCNDDTGECVLNVYFRPLRGLQHPEGLPREAEATFTGSDLPLGPWLEAADRLELSTEQPTGILWGGRGGGSETAIKSIHVHGTWDDEAAVTERLSSQTSNVAPCASREGAQRVYVVMDVDPSGDVGDLLTDPSFEVDSRAGCVRDALRGLEFQQRGQGALHRAELLVDFPADDSGIELQICQRRTDDPEIDAGAWKALRQLRTESARCLEEAGLDPSSQSVTVWAGLRIREHGRVARARVLPVELPPDVDPAGLAACLEEELSETLWPCSRSGQPADVSVTFRLGRRQVEPP